MVSGWPCQRTLLAETGDRQGGKKGDRGQTEREEERMTKRRERGRERRKEEEEEKRENKEGFQTLCRHAYLYGDRTPATHWVYHYVSRLDRS